MPTAADLAGQVLIIGFEGASLSPECGNLLAQVRPGGLIYFQRNIVEAEQFALLVKQSSDAAGRQDLFLAIDMEGGTVDRFRDLIGPLPAVADAVSAEAGRELGRLVGRELATFRLNVDFAPVLDLGLPASRSVLTSRTAGVTSSEVIQFAREFLAGLRESAVLGCGKHFPGLGGGTLDSHVNLPCIARSAAEVWAEDLAPYRDLSGLLPMVMVAHAWYPELEKELGWTGAARPASLSPQIVCDLLRGRIGYGGLVLCDDLEMGGALGGRTIEEAAIGAVDAGCDVLLVCRQADNVSRVHEALVHQAERSSEFMTRLATAGERMGVCAQRWGIGTSAPPTAQSTISTLRAEVAQFQSTVLENIARRR